MVPGSVLFADVASHFGSNYPAQLMMGFFTLLACISVAAFEAKKATIRSVKAPGQEQFAPALAAAETYLPPSETTAEPRHSLFAAGRGLV